MTFLLEGNCLGWIRWGGAGNLTNPLISPALGWGMRRVIDGNVCGGVTPVLARAALGVCRHSPVEGLSPSPGQPWHGSGQILWKWLFICCAESH